jgi:uncharacterized protein (TIGR03000 family)
LAAVVTAVLLWSASPSSAQRRGWGGRWDGGYRGWDGGWYGGWGYGGYPSGWYGGYGAYQYRDGWRTWDGSGYYGYPGARFSSYNPYPDARISGYYSPETPAVATEPNNAARVAVRVPPDAEVWFDDDKTQQKGTMREFISPALEPGHNYSYDIKARWNQNGKMVEQTRHVPVHAGDRVMVDFFAPPPGRSTTSSARPQTTGQAKETGNRLPQNAQTPQPPPPRP